jgi:hypothetical protein
MSPEARLAVILAADVTGYSRLMGADSRARTNASTRISARPDDQAFPIYRMGIVYSSWARRFYCGRDAPDLMAAKALLMALDG